MRINVAITDDHPMIIQGMKLMFSNYKHINLCAVYQSGAELLATILPDVLLLDIQLSDKTGDELMPELMERYPELKVLVVTNFDSTMYAEKMLWQGAKGFLLKTADEYELVKAIETVYTGEQYIEKGLAKRIAHESARNRKVYTGKSTLTEREKEILQLIVEGKTDQEIADQLFLGLNTIKFYRKGMLLKLDVPNTASLVAKALKMGWAK
jgi:DNA-binding NarL/FixJ family response regulator